MSPRCSIARGGRCKRPMGTRCTSDQKLRWCAATLWAMEWQLGRVKHRSHLALLEQSFQNRLCFTNSTAA